MRTILSLLGIALLLLLHPANPTAAVAPMAPGDGPALAGRNCGGTSKPGSLSAFAQPAASGGPGWTVGGALDKPAATGNQLAPSVAVSPAGAVFYAWQEQRSGDGGDIFAASLAGEMTSGRRAVRVDDTGASAVEQASPALAVDGAGRIHAVWEDLRGGSQRGLYYASSADGASWGANTPLTGSLASLNHISPHLVAGASDALYLAWDGGNDIYFSYRERGLWSAPEPINALRAVDRDLPRLALDAQGGLLAAWEDRRSATPTVFVAYSAAPSDGAWGAEVRATPLGVWAQRPSIAAAPDGTLYLAYQGDAGIFMISSGDKGATWSEPQRVDDGAGNAFANPQVAVDANGGVHCIWCRLRSTDGFADVAGARSTDGGATWGDRAVLASTTGTAEPLGLAADQHGNIFAAWSDDSAGSTALHTAQWSDGLTLFLPILRR
jgi:hypothetical protein